MVTIFVGRDKDSSARARDSEADVRTKIGSGRDVDRRLCASSHALSRPGLLVDVVKFDMQSSGECKECKQSECVAVFPCIFIFILNKI